MKSLKICLYLLLGFAVLVDVVLGETARIVRDGHLDALTNVLNSDASRSLFAHWNGSESDTDAFLRLLDPLLLSEDVTPMHSYALDSTFNKTYPAIDCSNPLYSAVFNGKSLGG